MQTNETQNSGMGQAAGQLPAPAATEERGFAAGELVVLRPVQETDLAELAQLLAENPYDRHPQPWTPQRLKQKFEDKDKPGLWQERERYFSVVRKTGGVVGFIHEEDNDGHTGMWWNSLHIAAALPDREALGRDMLAAYIAYKRRWHNPLRIEFSLAACELDEARWLEEAGFELEVALDDAVLYQGRPQAELVYSWISDYVRQLHDNGGPVAGEDGQAPEGTPVAHGNSGLPRHKE